MRFACYKLSFSRLPTFAFYIRSSFMHVFVSSSICHAASATERVSARRQDAERRLFSFSRVLLATRTDCTGPRRPASGTEMMWRFIGPYVGVCSPFLSSVVVHVSSAVTIMQKRKLSQRTTTCTGPQRPKLSHGNNRCGVFRCVYLCYLDTFVVSFRFIVINDMIKTVLGLLFLPVAYDVPLWKRDVVIRVRTLQ